MVFCVCPNQGVISKYVSCSIIAMLFVLDVKLIHFFFCQSYLPFIAISIEPPSNATYFIDSNGFAEWAHIFGWNGFCLFPCEWHNDSLEPKHTFNIFKAVHCEKMDKYLIIIDCQCDVALASARLNLSYIYVAIVIRIGVVVGLAWLKFHMNWLLYFIKIHTLRRKCTHMSIDYRTCSISEYHVYR